MLLYSNQIRFKGYITFFLGRSKAGRDSKVTITARAYTLQKILPYIDKKVGSIVEGYNLQKILPYIDKKVGKY